MVWRLNCDATKDLISPFNRSAPLYGSIVRTETKALNGKQMKTRPGGQSPLVHRRNLFPLDDVPCIPQSNRSSQDVDLVNFPRGHRKKQNLDT